jgi:Mrp family chromosome partitioning ATPase
MADILRSAERELAARPEPAPVKAVPVDAPLDADTDPTVPFIEVGGPKEPVLRLLPGPPSRPKPPLPPDPDDGRPEESDSDTPPPPPGLFTIRFQPLRAGRRPGRGFGPELIAFHQPDHPISVQYRSLAAEIIAQLPGSRPRVLLFTAAGQCAGTTTVVLNLAVSLARREDTTVTLVDANFARPSVAPRLGLPAAPGLGEALARQTPLTWCLQETPQQNLLVLPAGRPAGSRAEGSLAALLEPLRDRNDWVLVDAAGWADGPEPAELADACDAIYLVLRADDAGKPAVTALQDTILEQTGRLRGCVLTQGQ